MNLVSVKVFLVLLFCNIVFLDQAVGQAQTSCEALPSSFSYNGANVEINSSTWEESKSLQSGQFSPPTLMPSHCHVEGVLDRRIGAQGKEYFIGFAVNLPENWNGRFLFQGGGGLNGSIGEPIGEQATGDVSALAKGFAVVSTDSGHQGGIFDASFQEDQEAPIPR